MCLKNVVQSVCLCCCTHSTVNSWAPTGMQYTNCMALHRRWNSTHSSTCITPLLGSGPRQMVSSKKARTRVRMTSNMDRPQQSLSLVRRSPSRAMAICWKRSEGCGYNPSPVTHWSMADSARQAMVWMYLWGAEALNEGNHVQRCVLGFQTLHLSIKTFALCRGKNI